MPALGLGAGLRLLAEEQPTDLRIPQQFVARAGKRYLAGHQDIADIGEFQPI